MIREILEPFHRSLIGTHGGVRIAMTWHAGEVVRTFAQHDWIAGMIDVNDVSIRRNFRWASGHGGADFFFNRPCVRGVMWLQRIMHLCRCGSLKRQQHCCGKQPKLLRTHFALLEMGKWDAMIWIDFTAIMEVT